MSVKRIAPIILSADNELWYNNTLSSSRNTSMDNNDSNNNTTNLHANHVTSSASSNTNSNNNDEAHDDINSTATTTSSNINDSHKYSTENHQPINYKFYVPRQVEIVKWHFKILTPCVDCPAIVLYAQANGLPTLKDYMQTSVFETNRTDEICLEFYPHQNAWHHLEINFLSRIAAVSQVMSLTKYSANI